MDRTFRIEATMQIVMEADEIDQRNLILCVPGDELADLERVMRATMDIPLDMVEACVKIDRMYVQAPKGAVE